MRKLLLSLGASLAVIGCATPGIVEQGGQRVISQGQAQQAAQQHPAILQEFGGEVGGGVSSYVAQVGQRVAQQSGIGGGFAFTALNSPVANAFAVPGGRVYVTRQLLALMNSEEELAFVLGHEAGHIAADHSAQRQNTGLYSQLGALVLGAVTGSGQVAQLAGTAAQGYISSYSRSQEYEADDLGIRYTASAGYDPLASAKILSTLETYGEVQTRFGGRADDQRAAPSWNRSHPTSEQRVARARQQAQATGATTPGTIAGRERHLAAIDGMLYDDDPRQGVVQGRDFLHPELRFAFTAPQGYGIQNSTRAVGVSGPAGQAQFSTAPFSGDLDAFVGQVFRQLGGQQTNIPYSPPQRTTINGIPAAVSTGRAQTQSGVVDVGVVAYQFGPNQAYYFLTLTRGGAGLVPFEQMIGSVRRLGGQEASAIRPRVIDVVTVGSRDTIESLGRRMAYSDYQVERFRVLNGLTGGETVRAGQRVKLVVYGTPAR